MRLYNKIVLLPFLAILILITGNFGCSTSLVNSDTNQLKVPNANGPCDPTIYVAGTLIDKNSGHGLFYDSHLTHGASSSSAKSTIWEDVRCIGSEGFVELEAKCFENAKVSSGNMASVYKKCMTEYLRRKY